MLRAAVAAVLLLALVWSVGGQSRLGRIDPALALPLMPLPALLLAWFQRREEWRVRRLAIAVSLCLLLVVQGALALVFSDRAPWLQLGLVAIGWLAALLLADAMMQWRRRGRVLRLALAVLVTAGWFAGGHLLLAALYRSSVVSGPPATMLTGLPLRWSGGSDLSAMLAQGTNDDPALTALDAAGPLRLVDSVVDNPPPPGGTLLLAHPRALAPKELVAIDAFVRDGGHAVILADALTSWPMRHPLGDPRNPPVTSLLTPLLDHWGVTLGPAPTGDPGIVSGDIDGARLRLFSAGRFQALPPTCRAYADGHVARCRIGQGEVWLVGDADLLFAPLWQPDTPWATHLRKADSIEWLGARLWPDAVGAALQPLWIRGVP